MPNVNVLSVVKYAPVVLIVLGIEVLIYAARPDVKIKYDVIPSSSALSSCSRRGLPVQWPQ